MSDSSKKPLLTVSKQISSNIVISGNTSVDTNPLKENDANNSTPRVSIVKSDMHPSIANPKQGSSHLFPPMEEKKYLMCYTQHMKNESVRTADATDSAASTHVSDNCVGIGELMELNLHNLSLLKNNNFGLLMEKKKKECPADTKVTCAGNTSSDVQGRKVDPRYKNVSYQVVRKFHVRNLEKYAYSEEQNREVIVHKIYQTPEILLIKDILTPFECEKLRNSIETFKLIDSPVQWTTKNLSYPSHVILPTKTAPFRSIVRRVQQIGSIENELQCQFVIIERLPGSDQYPTRLTAYKPSPVLMTLTDSIWNREGEAVTALLFLNGNGGNLDFYQLGFAAKPTEGTVLILKHPSFSNQKKSDNPFDWHDLCGDPRETRLMLILRFKK